MTIVVQFNKKIDPSGTPNSILHHSLKLHLFSTKSEKLVVNISSSNPHFTLMIGNFNAKSGVAHLITKLQLEVPK